MFVRNLSTCAKVFEAMGAPMVRQAWSLDQEDGVDTRYVEKQGRLWKKSEDDILKAAFMKNGMYLLPSIAYLSAR